ncbi:MAG: leucine-rich repeat protein [Lachnospiraceae bacterium]|nr:leucine-rich repeat protein [Lachnospiraceae bacterium]
MIQNNQTPMRLVWEPIETGARLLRVYGMQNVLTVPETIEGVPVTKIGAYCFAGTERIPDRDTVRSTLIGMEETKHLHPVAGNDLERITLPDSLTGLEDLSFYNCRELTLIQLGKFAEEIGSDVFMNCRRLNVLQIRGNIREKTGAKAILSRIPWEIQVDFLEGEYASVLYPEYTDSYDEIAPAHIFGRNITGEGFRARQLFSDGIVQLASYDEIFPKVTAEETALTAGKMALLRLRYPVDLSQKAKNRYEERLRQVSGEVGVYYVGQKNLSALEFLCRECYLSGVAMEQVIDAAVAANWSEGSAGLMDWKFRYGRSRRESRYSFD